MHSRFYVNRVSERNVEVKNSSHCAVCSFCFSEFPLLAQNSWVRISDLCLLWTATLWLFCKVREIDLAGWLTSSLCSTSTFLFSSMIFPHSVHELCLFFVSNYYFRLLSKTNMCISIYRWFIDRMLSISHLCSNFYISNPKPKWTRRKTNMV
jgi:hypothetical protein